MPIDEITQKVSERYAKAANTGEQMCCPTNYDMGHLKTFIPEEVLKISYGCGTPAGLKTVRAGETVLDIGSGGGIDCFEASRLVGPTGQVIGIDMTDTMLEIARKNASVVAANLGYSTSNVEFRKGLADAMPVEDGTIDLIISNCVINLAPDKRMVFREMYRVAKPGGRFTISDIVSDQTVPQYLVHDTQKWGDCLSGALTLMDYMNGITEAGFLGIHLIKSSPWRVIDGIHFFSVTLTGYKLPPAPAGSAVRYATLRGPFSRLVDERGTTYQRGIPQSITAEEARLLSMPPFTDHFLLTTEPVRLNDHDPRWSAILSADTPCSWQGHYALLAGPFVEAADDDHHVYRRGEPLEICSKTVAVLETNGYQPHFVILNRAGEQVNGGAVSCSPDGGCC
ncbi:MAG: methyltransferase domain-containing protein [Nitrospira sp.]|nr:methyltransferase domain-containing protein [Nitrospira sp.]MDH4305329.1 methyltransferase domain-containing protein [Nitrospira sp.]MDH5193957.1 methyltransferase domain-containing protein [Nitrospira sp.]